VAIDPERPEVVVVSASSGPYSAYVGGRSDGRVYRRVTHERWERVRDGWPEPASTIAPLLCAGVTGGELWAADERGVHRSDDGGKRWRRAVGYATSPRHLRGLALVR
jgi:outer membrane protein assembly factor BamB